MTRETKVGLLMVVMLVGVFGFMVYKNMHRPSEAMADQNREAVAPENEAEVLPFANVSDNGGEPAQPKNQVVTAAAAAPAVIPENSSAVRVVPRDVDRFEVSDAPTANVKPKLPTSIPNDDAFFDAQPKQTVTVEQREPVEASRQPAAAFDPFMEEAKPSTRTNVAAQRSDTPIESPATTNSDPFEAPLEVAQPTPQAAPRSVPVADPFETTQPAATNTEPVLVLEAPPRKSVSLPIEAFDVIEEPKQTAPALKAPTFEPAASEISPAPQPANRTGNEADEDRLGGFRPVEVNKRSMNEFTREERTAPTAIPASDPFGAARRPAPAARIDEDFAPRATSQALVPGDTYNIEPNDNFWTISRKKYGTGRYFMALSQHNLSVIPDPKRMKPGVTIATPSTDLLEKTYPTLIPKAAPSDTALAGESSAPSTAIRRTNATTNEEAGFFVSTDGVPMYRVGSEDTLSDIAKRHLGRSSRWVQVFEMNRDTLTDGNTLKVGTLLRLPGDASRVDVVGTPRVIR